MMRRSFLFALATLSISSLVRAHAEPSTKQRTARINSGWPMDRFALTDQFGRPFTQDNLRGRWTFVLFGDARGNEPCTAALSALTGMCQRIARTQKVKSTQVVFVSLVEDAPGQLRSYLAGFDERFVGASGPAGVTAHLADDLGVEAAATLVPGDAARGSTLSSVLALVDPEGMVWGQYLPPFDVMLLTARYLKSRVGR
jgi:protein SCO1/2